MKIWKSTFCREFN